MADQGHSCLLVLLEEVKSHRAIPRIIDELNSKNGAMRQRIAEYIFVILKCYDASIIEKYQTILEGAISTTLQDANKEVRQLARKSFQTYSELYRERADRMFAKFDAAVQKALTDEYYTEPKLSPLKKTAASPTDPPAKLSKKNSVKGFERSESMSTQRMDVEYMKSTRIPDSELFENNRMIEEVTTTRRSKNIVNKTGTTSRERSPKKATTIEPTAYKFAADEYSDEDNLAEITTTTSIRTKAEPKASPSKINLDPISTRVSTVAKTDRKTGQIVR